MELSSPIGYRKLPTAVGFAADDEERRQAELKAPYAQRWPPAVPVGGQLPDRESATGPRRRFTSKSPCASR